MVMTLLSLVNSTLLSQGCFWGIDNYFNKHFKDAIVSSEVGYTGGEIKDPDYRRVCTLPAVLSSHTVLPRSHLPL